VTGTITTDGTIGVLSTLNVTDFNLLLAVGSTTYDLTGPLSGDNAYSYVHGSDFTSTPTGLFFNFWLADVSSAALPLFATGLGLMGLLGWRRKRKASAALTAS
jgi:hypothetical protein